MVTWLLIVAAENADFVDMQKAWLRKNMFLTIVPSIKSVVGKLWEKDYLAVVVFSEDSDLAQQIQDIWKVWSKTPIICLKPEHSKTQKELAGKLESIVDAIRPETSGEHGHNSMKTPAASPTKALICRELSVYPQFRLVVFHGQEVRLSRCQFDALTALLENCGRLLTFDQLYDRVYGEFTEASNAYGSSRYFIAEIRRRLNEIAEFDYIENVRGVGYRIRFGLK